MTNTRCKPGTTARLVRRYIFIFAAAAVLCPAFSVVDANAQEEEKLPEGVVPPPLSIVAKDEKEKLEEEDNASKRTKLAIAFMDNRLERSKNLADELKFQDSLNQLGRFTGLMNSVLQDLDRKAYRKKSLKNNKKFEMALRGFIPRLELVRRALPYSHSFHVSKLIKAVREARRRTIEPFFGDTVLPEGT